MLRVYIYAKVVRKSFGKVPSDINRYGGGGDGRTGDAWMAPLHETQIGSSSWCEGTIVLAWRYHFANIDRRFIPF